MKIAHRVASKLRTNYTHTFWITLFFPGNLQLSFGVYQLQVLLPSIDHPIRKTNWKRKLETGEVGVIFRYQLERKVQVYWVQRLWRLVVGGKLFRTHLQRRWSLGYQVRCHSYRGPPTGSGILPGRPFHESRIPTNFSHKYPASRSLFLANYASVNVS